MGDTLTKELPPFTIRRAGLVDLERLGWLIARLHERHPRVSPANIKVWLRSASFSNEMWFGITDHAAALVEVSRVPMERQPVATEVFVLAESDEWTHEAAAMYPAMASWAAHLDCSTFEVDRFTDVTRIQIKKVMGINFIPRSTAYFTLGSVT
jgi:hypothetical protein